MRTDINSGRAAFRQILYSKLILNGINKNMLVAQIIAFVLFFMTSTKLVLSYEPPAGIPSPPFGIDENIPNIYGSEQFFTYYIDNTHTNATDLDNPYGSLTKPRKSIPSKLTMVKGNVLLIAGGPYRINATLTWKGEGTPEQPVFIRGMDKVPKPRLVNAHLQLDGRYLILENLDFYDDTWIKTKETADHLAVRNCEIHNPPGKIVSYGAAVMARGSDIVIYRNHIHHHVTDDPKRGGDIHGVRPGVGAKRVWVLENDIHHNSGDAIQACHYCEPRPQFIYIGRNILHEDRENAVDLKYASDIIISQNKMYGYGDATTSDGSAVVLGSDGMPNRSWVIFNEIYNSKNGIRNEETDVAWIIGNRIYNIRGFAIALEKKSDDLYIINNTIYNVDTAIDQLRADREAFTIHVLNNIFSDIGGKKHGCQIYVPSAVIAGRSSLDNNLFWQSDTPLKIEWGEEWNIISSSGFSVIPNAEGNRLADPQFVNAAAGDFDLKPASSAVDKAIDSDVYEQFRRLYHIDISVDGAGVSRPQGVARDIGALEYRAK